MQNCSTGDIFVTALFITFLVLKLCKVITWSWLWIFAPFWVPLVIFLAMVIVMILYDSCEVMVKHFQIKAMVKRLNNRKN